MFCAEASDEIFLFDGAGKVSRPVQATSSTEVSIIKQVDHATRTGLI
jgi:hypothetical protein